MKIVKIIEKWTRLKDSNYDWIVDDFIVDLISLNRTRLKFQSRRRYKNKEKIKEYNKKYYEEKRRVDLWCTIRYKKQ